MGACLSSKPSVAEDGRDSPRERLRQKGSLDSRVCVNSSSSLVSRVNSSNVSHMNSSKRNQIVASKDTFDGADVRAMLIEKKVHGLNRYYEDQIEKKADKFGDRLDVRNKAENDGAVVVNHLGLGRLPKAIEGEQAAAGWPSWLASVAGEALKGWLPRRASTFEKLEKIGQGTYSTVYRARDITNNKIVALKRVRFDHNDLESIKFMAREILILRRLNHPNVIKLDGLITSPVSCSLYLVFEYMEHDLVGLSSVPSIKFTEPQIKCYLHQLLSGLDHCHSRGVLHRDIKGSNLLIDSNGILKIADFGLASLFDPHHSTPLTSRVITLWYRPPELLLGASHYGVAVDLWSTGCILGELYAGKPILPGKTEVEQLHKIFKLCGSPSDDYWRKLKLHHSTVFKPVHPYRRSVAETFKDFPAPARGLMETLLSMDPSHRGTAALALKSEFFTTNPLACDPSSLPKYPPCKEIDAKLRDEEARKQRAVGCRDQKVDLENRPLREPRAIPAPKGNGDPATSLAQSGQPPNLRNRSQMLGLHNGDTHSSFLIDPPKQAQALNEARHDYVDRQNKKVSHSGPLVPGVRWTKGRQEHGDPRMSSTKPDLSAWSNLVSARTYEDFREKPGPSRSAALNHGGRSQGSFNEADLALKLDRRSHNQKTAESPQAGWGRPGFKEPTLQRSGPRGNKIYVSGPLLGPTSNLDQMLKDHDRKIQEFARRARLDKSKQRAHAQGKQVINNSTLVSMHVGR